MEREASVIPISLSPEVEITQIPLFDDEKQDKSKVFVEKKEQLKQRPKAHTMTFKNRTALLSVPDKNQTLSLRLPIPQRPSLKKHHEKKSDNDNDKQTPVIAEVDGKTNSPDSVSTSSEALYQTLKPISSQGYLICFLVTCLLISIAIPLLSHQGANINSEFRQEQILNIVKHKKWHLNEFEQLEMKFSKNWNSW